MTDHDSKATDMAGEPSNAEILQAVQKVSESQTDLKNKVEKIETALYGTGNPHGGLFGKFEALDAKIDGVEKTLTAKIDGVESKLEAKIDSVEKTLNRILSFAKVATVGLGIPILIEVLLPTIRRWTENFSNSRAAGKCKGNTPLPKKATFTTTTGIDTCNSPKKEGGFITAPANASNATTV